MAPRPILKSQPHLSPFPFTDDNSTSAEFPTPTCSNNPLPFAYSRIPPFDSPHVHFPPTPILTRIEMTHSPFSYDRKPILVSPNACALPDRGERDVINIDGSQDTSNVSPECYGGYFPAHLNECYPGSEMPSSKPSSSVRGPVTSEEGEERFASRPSRPYYARHQTPYHALSQTVRPVNDYSFSDSQHLPPPLVFDPSSESESDSCISPPMDASLSTPDISHISANFSSGGLSVCPNEQPRFSFITDNGNEFAARDILVDLDKRIGKKTRTRKHQNGSSEWCSGFPTDSISAPGGTLHRTKRTRASTTRDCTGVNNFCEPSLDGCLGGF